MANFVISRIKVEDFARWKEVYDAHKHARDAAGISEKYLFQDVDDPNTVTLLFEAGDMEKAKEFGASEDLIKAMAESGVVGEPGMYYLTD